jgi:hypothetical protein
MATAAVAACAILLDSPPIPFPTCLFRLITGRPCPSCFLTHAFIALGHGHLLEAMRDNLMSPILAAALCLTFFVAVGDIVADRNSLHRLWTRGERFIVPATLLLALVAWFWNIYKASIG